MPFLNSTPIGQIVDFKTGWRHGLILENQKFKIEQII